MSDGLDLLVVGAHPDDAEVHVGGILALASERGLAAAILDLTAGELGTRGSAETRKVESMDSTRILGVHRIILDLPDGRFDEGEGNRLKLMMEIRHQRPAVIVLPAPDDRHPDHRRAHRLCAEAAYYAGLKNYPCPGEPWRPRAIAWMGGENPGRPGPPGGCVAGVGPPHGRFRRLRKPVPGRSRRPGDPHRPPRLPARGPRPGHALGLAHDGRLGRRPVLRKTHSFPFARTGPEAGLTRSAFFAVRARIPFTSTWRGPSQA